MSRNPPENAVEVASHDLFCRRWNFEAGEDAVYVCKDDHEKGRPCEHEKMSGEEAVELIEKLRSIILKQNVKAHPPLPAGAEFDHGVKVVTTGCHLNRAAGRGWMSRLVEQSRCAATPCFGR